MTPKLTVHFFHRSLLQTIALIAVREGVVQLGSMKKVHPADTVLRPLHSATALQLA
jgi:hypothetical protein